MPHVGGVLKKTSGQPIQVNLDNNLYNIYTICIMTSLDSIGVGRWCRRYDWGSDACMLLVGTPTGSKTLGRQGRRWEENVERGL